jgi:hypothetical protein
MTEHLACVLVDANGSPLAVTSDRELARSVVDDDSGVNALAEGVHFQVPSLDVDRDEPEAPPSISLDHFEADTEEVLRLGAD